MLEYQEKEIPQVDYMFLRVKGRRCCGSRVCGFSSSAFKYSTA